MNIQVISARDGRRELITISEPLTILPGETVNRLVSDNGVEHWFTADGRYDGWGVDLSASPLSASEARLLMKAIEEERKFISESDL